jgi:hypothetical protein
MENVDNLAELPAGYPRVRRCGDVTSALSEKGAWLAAGASREPKYRLAMHRDCRKMIPDDAVSAKAQSGNPINARYA